MLQPALVHVIGVVGQVENRQLFHFEKKIQNVMYSINENIT